MGAPSARWFEPVEAHWSALSLFIFPLLHPAPSPSLEIAHMKATDAVLLLALLIGGAEALVLPPRPAPVYASELVDSGVVFAR